MPIDRRTVLAAAGGISAAALSAEAAEAAAVGNMSAASTGAIPKVELKWAFTIIMFFKDRYVIQSRPTRAYVAPHGGEIFGPRLKGTVVPFSGADYARGGGLEAHYVLKADDGALIYIKNVGYMKRLSPPGPPAPPRAKPAAGQAPNQLLITNGVPDNTTLRMRICPTFDAPKGPHDWMNRTVVVGHGARFVDPDHTIFTYYEVV